MAPAVLAGTNAWSIITSANVAGDTNALYGVATVDSSHIWSVGTSYDGTLHYTLIEHYGASSAVPTYRGRRQTTCTASPRSVLRTPGPSAPRKLAASSTP